MKTLHYTAHRTTKKEHNKIFEYQENLLNKQL
jgi:hypothetical protein